MSQQDFLFNNHLVAGLYPVQDAFAGGVYTDVISMKNYRRCTFVVMTGAIEDAGISNLLTVESCDDTAASNSTAIAFKSRICPSSTTVDTWTALTDRATTGYNAALAQPAANGMWLVEVTSSQMEAGAADYQFVRLRIQETANKTITAAVLVILSDPRYPQPIPVGAIS